MPYAFAISAPVAAIVVVPDIGTVFTNFQAFGSAEEPLNTYNFTSLIFTPLLYGSILTPTEEASIAAKFRLALVTEFKVT